MDIKKVLRNLARVGIVSSVNPADMTARVTFPDRDDLVSADLYIITTGSQDTKVYWLPYVGEQVVCLFSANDNNLTEGYILGTMYNSKDTHRQTGKACERSSLRTVRALSTITAISQLTPRAA